MIDLNQIPPDIAKHLIVALSLLLVLAAVGTITLLIFTWNAGKSAGLAERLKNEADQHRYARERLESELQNLRNQDTD